MALVSNREYISVNVKAKTLFSTYHELTKLEESLNGIKSMWKSLKKIIKLPYKLKGSSNKSYGINVVDLRIYLKNY